MSDTRDPPDPHSEREALEAAIRILVKEHARLTHSITAGGDHALLAGSGRINMQAEADGQLRLALEFFGGWIYLRCTPQDAVAIAAGLQNHAAAVARQAGAPADPTGA